MNGISRRSDARLVERHRNDFMAAEIADVANLDCQVLARLPLDIESAVDGIGQFVGAIVGSKGEQRSPGGDRRCIRQKVRNVGGIAGRARSQRAAPGIGERVAGGWVAGGDEALIQERRAALLRAHERRRLVHAERAARDYPGGVAGREIAEQLAAIIVDPAARPGPRSYYRISSDSTPRRSGEQTPTGVPSAWSC